MLLKINTVAAKRNTFHFQAQALFLHAMVSQANVAARTDDAVPWQSVHNRVAPQQLRYGAVQARVTRCRGNRAVGADLAGWDGEDHAPKRLITSLAGPHALVQQGSLCALECGLGGVPVSLRRHTDVVYPAVARTPIR